MKLTNEELDILIECIDISETHYYQYITSKSYTRMKLLKKLKNTRSSSIRNSIKKG